MYTGQTMKFDSYYTGLGEFIELLRSAANKEVVQPVKEAIHEPSEFDEDKEVQFAKKKAKELITPHFVR